MVARATYRIPLNFKTTMLLELMFFSEQRCCAKPLTDYKWKKPSLRFSSNAKAQNWIVDSFLVHLTFGIFICWIHLLQHKSSRGMKSFCPIGSLHVVESYQILLFSVAFNIALEVGATLLPSISWTLRYVMCPNKAFVQIQSKCMFALLVPVNYLYYSTERCRLAKSQVFTRIRKEDWRIKIC